jgi:hypothetical protein
MREISRPSGKANPPPQASVRISEARMFTFFSFEKPWNHQSHKIKAFGKNKRACDNRPGKDILFRLHLYRQQARLATPQVQINFLFNDGVGDFWP